MSSDKSTVLSQKGGWFYALVSQAMWGTGGVAIKLVDKSLPGTLMVALRHGIGATVLGISIMKGKRNVLKNAPWLHLLLIGILGACLADLALVGSVRRSGAIIAVMLARLDIPLGVMFSHFLLKEKVDFKAYLAAFIAFGGVILISYRPGQHIALHSQFYLGVVLGVSAAVTWALSGVYAKYLLDKKNIDPLALSFVRLGVGSIFSLIVAATLLRVPFAILGHLTTRDWLLIFYLGIFLSGLAYLFFYRALEVIDNYVASIILSISIVILLVTGLAVGEHISLLQWGGILLVGLSIWLISKKPTPATD